MEVGQATLVDGVAELVHDGELRQHDGLSGRMARNRREEQSNHSRGKWEGGKDAEHRSIQTIYKAVRENAVAIIND